MRTVLICQESAPLTRHAMARWLASSSDLAGLVILRERRGGLWRKLRREARRVGWLRVGDVLAFRVWQKLFHSGADAAFETRMLDRLCLKYPSLRDDVPQLVSTTPNSSAVVRFLEEQQPDVIIASCKHILKPEVFSVARTGTFALHPGICPEYRNAHGCFWALASGDPGNVGTTLLKIDAGVDTGPVYGYFRGEYDELRETHLMIQRRMTLENLDQIAEKLQEIHEGRAQSIDVSGRPSREWGQPWLTAYWRWKRGARSRARQRSAEVRPEATH